MQTDFTSTKYGATMQTNSNNEQRLSEENKNFVMKELFGLSNMTLSYIECNCNMKDNAALITDIQAIWKCHLIEDCLITNFNMHNFEVSLIALIVEYSRIEPFIISNTMSDRSHCDGATNMDLIDTTFRMPKDGIIKEWTFYARRKATLYGTVWRNSNYSQTNGDFNNNDKKPEYKLIAIVKFPVIIGTYCTYKHALPVNEEIEVLKGDLIGIRWDGHSSIPSSIGSGNRVHWLTGTTTPKIDETRQFTVGDYRDYAYGFKALI
eukprot:423071_1